MASVRAPAPTQPRRGLQEYLADKKHPTGRTRQKNYPGSYGGPGGGSVSYERGTSESVSLLVRCLFRFLLTFTTEPLTHSMYWVTSDLRTPRPRCTILGSSVQACAAQSLRTTVRGGCGLPGSSSLVLSLPLAYSCRVFHLNNRRLFSDRGCSR